MGQASASSSSSSGINSTGGSVSYSKPNYVAWVVAGVVALLAFVFLMKRKK